LFGSCLDFLQRYSATAAVVETVPVQRTLTATCANVHTTRPGTAGGRKWQACTSINTPGGGLFRFANRKFTILIGEDPNLLLDRGSGLQLVVHRPRYFEQFWTGHFGR
jgi:hypothetical protein